MGRPEQSPRLRAPIKDVAPAEADANYFATLKETAIAA
jgi:hypothetical protein